MAKLFAIILLISLPLLSKAGVPDTVADRITMSVESLIQQENTDSLKSTPVSTDSLFKVEEVLEPIYSPVWQGPKKAFLNEFTYVSIPLIVAGSVLHLEQKSFRDLRNRFIPKFKVQFDDYVQYSPLVVCTAIKAFGGETRSSWPRYIVSSAYSAAIMAIMVNGLKYTVKEMRPDDSKRNSFPSGHTATVFMGASIMARELGWRSPWYSIGAYGVAAATGIFRILNNRHWINDVVFGAGLGILAVDLGYFLGDMTFKDKGLNHKSLQHGEPSLTGRPSFIGIGMSAGTTLSITAPAIFDRYENRVSMIPASDSRPLNLNLEMGATIGVKVEGAYFFNTTWGIGAEAGMTACPVRPVINGDFRSFEINGSFLGLDNRPFSLYKTDELYSSTLGVCNFNAGPYYSLLLGKRWRFGAKLLIGANINSEFDILCDASVTPEFANALNRMLETNVITTEQYEEALNYGKEFKFLSIDPSASFSGTLGASVTYAMRRNSSLQLFVDYNLSAPSFDYKLYSRMDMERNGNGKYTFTHIEDRFNQRSIFHYFRIGMSFITHL